MSIGLNQFGVGTLTSPTQVAGVAGDPGNDQKLKNMLAAVKLRNRAQPVSLNVMTSVLPLGVYSSSGGSSNPHTPQYVLHRLEQDSFIKSVQVTVTGCYSTTGVPEVTVDGYITQAASVSISPFLALPEHALDPDENAEVVQIMRDHKIKATPEFSLQGGGFPKGIFTLPVRNQLIPANKTFVLRFTPPAYNGSSPEGWNYASVTIHCGEFHIT